MTSCAICLEDIRKNNVIVLNCNHKFCKSCILDNLEKLQNCPLCREKLKFKLKPITTQRLENILYAIVYTTVVLTHIVIILTSCLITIHIFKTTSSVIVMIEYFAMIIFICYFAENIEHFALL